MTQKSQTEKIIWGIIFRITLLPLIMLFAFLFSRNFQELISYGLSYPRCGGGTLLGDTTFCGDFLGIIISFIFWLGIVYGFLGKKIDYVVIGIFLVLALSFFLTDQNVSVQILSTFIIFAVVGNIFGYLLKQIRLQMFPGWR
jgi:hypothetical protein